MKVFDTYDAEYAYVTWDGEPVVRTRKYLFKTAAKTRSGILASARRGAEIECSSVSNQAFAYVLGDSIITHPFPWDETK